MQALFGDVVSEEFANLPVDQQEQFVRNHMTVMSRDEAHEHGLISFTSTSSVSESSSMSLRTLAALALAPTVLLTSSLNHEHHPSAGFSISRCCEGQGQEFVQGAINYQAKDQEGAHLGRKVRPEQVSGTRLEGSQMQWSPVLGQSPGGHELQRLSVRVKRPCLVEGMREMQDAAVVHSGIRSDRVVSISRTNPGGCDSGDPVRGRGGSEVQRHHEGQVHWSGGSREEPPRQVGETPEEEGSSGMFPQETGTCQNGSKACGCGTTSSTPFSQGTSRNCRTFGKRRRGVGHQRWFTPGSFLDANYSMEDIQDLDYDMVAEVESADVEMIVDEEMHEYKGMTEYKEVPEDDDTFQFDAVIPEVVKQLNPDEKYLLEQCLQDRQQEVEQSFFECGGVSPSEKWDVLELCCEEGSLLTKAVWQAGGKSGRAGLFNSCDLLRPEGRENVRRLLREHRPRWLWLAFPCGATSNIQNLNELTYEAWVKSLARKKKSRKLVREGLAIAQEHVLSGGEVLQEWPRYNLAWSFPEVQKFWQQFSFEDVKLDGCMYGLQHRGVPVKKPWKLRCSVKGGITSMARLCDGRHEHAPCLGGDVAKRSAFYTPEMCRLAAKCLMAPQEKINDVFGALEIKIDREGLRTLTEEEVNKMAMNVLKLHRRCGHPSNRALVKALAARGADPRTLAIAEKIQCSECQEARLNKPGVVVSLEKEDQLWHTLQMDAFVFRYGNRVHHFLLFVDEASSFAVVAETVIHSDEFSANVDTKTVIDALLGSWIQYFGSPRKIRCDMEGAFRGRELAEFCEDRGIELEMVPAEHHQATGDVERAIGILRHKMEVHLKEVGPTENPRLAAYSMVAAHNSISRVGGYAPVQWAFGRDFTDDTNLPSMTSQATSGHEMSENLKLRLSAEKRFLEMQAAQKLSRAMNSKTRLVTKYIPGDLIYYKRYKPPADRPAHELVDMPRLRVSRWYGPAKVISVETRVSEEGTSRSPSSIVWAVGQGRLKKFHMDQIRHASETERLVAENSDTVVLPWTSPFSLNKGEFDDMTVANPATPAYRQRQARSRSRQPPVRRSYADGPGAVPHHVTEAHSDEEMVPETPMPGTMDSDFVGKVDLVDELDVIRLLADPTYQPLKRLASSEKLEGDVTFSSKQGEQVLYVARQSFQESVHWCNDSYHDCIFGVELPLPQNEGEWKQILKNPSKFTAKSMMKGVEVSWNKLNQQQREAMQEAKNLEIDQWMQEAVCQRFRGVIPQNRLMKMRWVLTLKGVDGKPDACKAKARIVLLGYSDPDLENLSTAAPTLSRRSRQMILNLCTLRRWSVVKADAKSAFLQGGNSQAKRGIFAVPVKELADSMKIPFGEAVQVLKAAYGLVSAPREWYLEVDDVITHKCQMKKLKTDPCVWILSATQEGEEPPRTIGVIASHVDDFLLCGDEQNERWKQVVATFKSSFRWSPWEHTPFVHCGVGIQQHSDFSFSLEHDHYCTEIKQVEVNKAVDHITPAELGQARAVLGAVQWRVIQSAPQHAAKLSWLQSALPNGSKDLLHQINKLCREVYSQRFTSVGVKDLQVTDETEVGFACWTDAAVGNRPDMSSTGGYLIGLVPIRMLSGEKGIVNPVSWKSGRLPRVARSSLNAEIQALAEGEQELMMCRAEWAELLGHELSLRNPEQTTIHVKAAIIIDAKSVYDCFYKGDTASSAFSMKEKYGALELLAVTESMNRQNTPLLWVASDVQLADGLTKSAAQDQLRVFLAKNQEWVVVYDPNFTAAKKKNKRVTPDESPAEMTSTMRTEDMTWAELIRQTSAPSSKRFRGV